MKKQYLIYSLLAVASFTACSVVDPMSAEQYKKEIYIVGANEGVASYDVPFGTEVPAFISLSASGTQKVDRDVEVILKYNEDIIEKYNAKYMLDEPVKYGQLPSQFTTVPNWTTTLKAGDIYTHFSFSVNTQSLHCDSLYCIGFEIESVSDYKKSDEGTTLIYRLNLTNDYSGTYHLDATKTALNLIDGEWSEQGMDIPVSIQRNLTATSANKVRFFHEKIKETLPEYSNSWNPGQDYFNAIENSCIEFIRIGDSNDFTIEAWENFTIETGGVASYDEENEVFTFSYDYFDGTNGPKYRMRGVFRK